MQGYEKDNLRRDLDEALLPFRLVRKRKGKAKSWVQSVRQATGLPVEELARRIGVGRWEIRRMEEAEKNSRIMMTTLKRAAEGLGCEVVYALVPKTGTLEDLASEQRKVRERVLRTRSEARAAARQPWLEEIGWREKFLGAMRTLLRNEGFRVRPRKTDRGVEKQMEEYRETMKLAGLAGKMAMVVKVYESQEESERDSG